MIPRLCLACLFVLSLVGCVSKVGTPLLADMLRDGTLAQVHDPYNGDFAEKWGKLAEDARAEGLITSFVLETGYFKLSGFREGDFTEVEWFGEAGNFEGVRAKPRRALSGTLAEQAQQLGLALGSDGEALLFRSHWATGDAPGPVVIELLQPVRRQESDAIRVWLVVVNGALRRSKWRITRRRRRSPSSRSTRGGANSTPRRSSAISTAG